MINFLNRYMNDDITEDMVVNISVNVRTLFAKLKTEGWLKTRLWLFDHIYLDPAGMITELDRLVFDSSIVDEDFKRRFNLLSCKYQNMLKGAFDHEMIFAGYMNEIKMMLDKLNS